MIEQEAIRLAAKELDIDPREHDLLTGEGFLAEKINDLIQNNFQKLVFILYRMDVSEEKLKLLLKENPTGDAGQIIAGLIIERQVQKIKTRHDFKQRDTEIDEDEKW